MQTKRALWLAVFSAFLWFIACESPISTEIKSGNLSSTQYEIYTSANIINDTAWSPDGERIAFVANSQASDIYKKSISGDTLCLINRFYNTFYPTDFTISPDGQYFIYFNYDPGKFDRLYDRYIYFADRDTSLLCNDFIPDNFYYPVWSRDSRFFYYMTRENLVYCINGVTPQGSRLFHVTLDSAQTFNGFTVAPYQQSIVWAGKVRNQDNSRLWLYTPTDGHSLLFGIDSVDCKYPSLSPDGQSIAYYTFDYRNQLSSINILSLADNSTYMLADSISLYNDFPITWSDDGQMLYYFGHFYDTYESNLGLWSISLSDQAARFCTYPGGMVLNLAADGSYYVIEDNLEIYSLYTISLADKKLSLLTQETEKIIKHPDWSPDGSKLVFTLDYQLHTIPAAGGKPKAIKIDRPYNHNNPDYSPDGSLIIFDDGNDLYTVPAEGGTANEINIKYLNYYHHALSQPNWSPDGKQIACYLYRNKKDSLLIVDYNDKNISISKEWPGTYSSITWSNTQPGIGSYLLYNVSVNGNGNMTSNEIQFRNMDNDQDYVLFGEKGSLGPFDIGFYGASWSPDCKSIAWIQKGLNPGDRYSLNIARIFLEIE